MATVILRPTSDASKSGVSAYSSGTDGYALVDESVLDTADWVDIKTQNAHISFGFGASGINADAKIVSVKYTWKGTNASIAYDGQVQARNPATGTRYDLGGIGMNATTAEYTRTTRPWDSQPYTTADINALQAGAREANNGSYLNLRIQQYYVTVTYVDPTPVTINAILMVPRSGSLTAGAFMVGPGYGWANADAIIRTQPSSSFTANAVIKATSERSFGAQAVLVPADIVLRPTSDALKLVSAYSSGTDAWALVDEASYSASDWVDIKARAYYVIFGFGPSGLGPAAIIDSVKYTWRGTNAAPSVTGYVQARNPSSGTRYDVATISSNNTLVEVTLTTRPWDSQPWTVADIDAIQAGARAYDNPTLNQVRVEQFYLTVKYHLAYGFTVDAYISTSHSASFTADAVITSGGYFFSADAAIIRRDESSFTADAIARRAYSSAFSLDCYVGIRVTSSFAIDAIVRTTSNPELITGFIEPIAEGWGNDFWVPENNTNIGYRLSVDSVYGGQARNGVGNDPSREWKIIGRKKSKRRLHATVGIKSGRFNISDAVLTFMLRHDDLWQSWTEFDMDYYNSTYYAFQIHWGVSNPTDDWSLNEAPLLASIGRNYNTYVLAPIDTGLTFKPLPNGGSRYHIVARVTGSNPTRLQFKMWKVGTPEPTKWLIDMEDSTGPQGTGWAGFRVATFASQDVTWSFNGIESTYLDSAFDVDAVLFKTVEASFSANGVVSGPVYASFTADALVRTARSGALTLDSLFCGGGTFTLDAVLGDTRAATVTADAVIRWTGEGTAQADAVLLTPRTVGASIDSIILSPSLGQVTADSFFLAVRLGSLSIDAVSLRPRSGSLVADAIRRVPRTKKLTGSAVVFRQSTVLVPVDAVKLKTQAGSLVIDAIRLEPRTGSLSLDAVKHQEITGLLDARAVVLKEQASSFALDAVVTVVRPEGMTSVLSVASIRSVIGAEQAHSVISPSFIRSRIGWARRDATFTVNARIT